MGSKKDGNESRKAGFTERNKSADFGGEPFVARISDAVEHNECFRAALWSGCHLQMTLMCIPCGGEIGAEVHPETDQFLCIESGSGCVKMSICGANICKNICAGDGIFIPAGARHNLVNTGECPLKLYSIYAPPQHRKGTVHRTKADADAAERH